MRVEQNSFIVNVFVCIFIFHSEIQSFSARARLSHVEFSNALMKTLLSQPWDLASSTAAVMMGVEEMDPGLKQLYLQKPYVKTAKKTSLLATIYEEPVQKTKSKEPQLMASRGLKR